MVYAYVMNDIANIETGFEGFFRHIKPEVNNSGNFYIFSGESDVDAYIKTIRDEFKEENIVEWFCTMMSGRVSDSDLAIFKEKAQNLIYDFDYSVAPEGSIIFPQMPVFQFKGPRWIGQMIETGITNCYNGKSGYSTLTYLKDRGLSDVSSIDMSYIESIVFNIGSAFQEHYVSDLRYRAQEFKAAAGDKGILEAAFRRAPSKGIAAIASRIALEEGWSGTSNTTIWGDQYQKSIGGTMAHAFVMSFPTELEAFRAWQKTMGASTILVDTYDTFIAVETLINENIKPKAVRLDSGDFFVDVPKVRKILDNAGWQDVAIFISGDLTPELLIKLDAFGIPFDMAMAGTKYVYNNSIIKRANCGFVYKVVEYTENGKRFFPLKKASGKQNYPAIKTFVETGGKIFAVPIDTQLTRQNLSIYKKINTDTEVLFSGNDF